MKRYLIVSLSTGGGHATAGNSLAERLKDRGNEVLVIDLFKGINAKGLHTFICEGYNFIATKAPQLYETIYRAGNKPIIAKGSFDITRRLSQKKIKEFINVFDPDVIIAVHPIVTDILGGMKQKGYLEKQKIVSVITDYLAHFVYVHKHKYIDAYFVGSDVTKRDLLKRGVNSEKIYPFGIPIKKEFYTPVNRFKNGKFTILVMGGSLGSRNMSSVLNRLMKVKDDLKIIVVCGKDQELKIKMDKFIDLQPGKEVAVYGFVTDVQRMMDEADLLISKPGGASVTEALLRRIPMIIPYMLGGQEKENRDYLIEENVAIWVSNVKDITNIVTKLINEPEILAKMGENMEQIAANFSVDNAIDVLVNL